MEHKVKPKKVLFFQAVTPVHMGAGQGLDHIDLPIQREQHTRYPIFYASGIKGALRQYALEKLKGEKDCSNKFLSELDKAIEENKWCDKNKNKESSNSEDNCEKNIELVAKIFGSQDCRGKLTVSDAKILFFPVKSLKGVFAYVSCPFVLTRYAEDTGNKELLEVLKNLKISEGEILSSETLKVGDNKVVLEEFEFEHKGNPNEVVEKLNLPDGLKEKISQRVAIVDNDTFGYFVENLTEVVNRIKINPETGTVKQGGLWTEEYLPAESVLYSLWFESQNLTEEETEYLPSEGSLLILGGDQTVGKGIVKLLQKEVNHENT